MPLKERRVTLIISTLKNILFGNTWFPFVKFPQLHISLTIDFSLKNSSVIRLWEIITTFSHRLCISLKQFESTSLSMERSESVISYCTKIQYFKKKKDKLGMVTYETCI